MRVDRLNASSVGEKLSNCAQRRFRPSMIQKGLYCVTRRGSWKLVRFEPNRSVGRHWTVRQRLRLARVRKEKKGAEEGLSVKCHQKRTLSATGTANYFEMRRELLIRTMLPI